MSQRDSGYERERVGAQFFERIKGMLVIGFLFAIISALILPDNQIQLSLFVFGYVYGGLWLQR